ncbi:MAG: 2-C-methyl-D-erythritol 2,4-cyclodiphosphate synthase [Nitrospiraceae bacterium]|jgi:2-C-methyl-D-erythritol 2,4-cyclodiphosphate synthase|nr:2-C-methyl-D-erythritol 2,4-cyclodiphosphate synthase [Nitrospiraceae bacterium]
MRIGIGYDSHRFQEGKTLVVGGVHIPYEMGLLAHSDGDVLCHAIMDAILGALGEGDIGKFFPDTDSQWKNAVSTDLLRTIVTLAGNRGFTIGWIDSIIITEQPKMAPYIEQMKDALSAVGLAREIISIKAKTNEKMGFVGRGEGMASQAVCLLLPR